MSKPIIEVHKIGKKYRIGQKQSYYSLRDTLMEIATLKYRRTPKEEFWAIKDVSFTVGRGEAVGIIGANGAGKSTLLKVLSQITPPTTGKITMGGRVASLLEVGTGFNPELTGRENIFLNGAILGMTRREIARKFDEIVAFSEVEQFIDTPVKHYSSGMHVRLAFSVAAHLEPDILIVDEVLAVGDALFQKKSLGKMEEVSTKEGRTVLFVSHNMQTVAMLCPRTVLLSKGKVIQDGETDKVIAKYIETKHLGIVPLVKRRDRKGDGTLKLTDMYFRSARGSKALEMVSVGESTELVMTIVVRPEAIGKEVFLNLTLVDEYGTKLATLRNDISSQKIIAKKKETIIVCQLPNGLPLLPGEYRLAFAIAIGRSHADKLADALSFNIALPKHSNIDRLPASSGGKMLLNQEWRNS